MRGDLTALDEYIAELASTARAGDRLPSVRELMARFELSQLLVQRALRHWHDKGAVEVRPGRGMYFSGAGIEGFPRTRDLTETPGVGRTAVKPRSVLILRRSVNIDRGGYFVDQFHRRFTGQGHRVIEVKFSDPDHAMAVLKGLPRFDACLIQSVYHSIPHNLLAMIQEKTRVVAFDGISLIGDQIDSVGTEWGEPLAQAVSALHSQGHRRICLAASSLPLMAITLGLRRWQNVPRWLPDVSTEEILLPMLPEEGYMEALVSALSSRLSGEQPLPFTALVTWGISDGQRFREMLSAAGVQVPRSLSIVLLGRTDLETEHGNFFDSFGPRVHDQVEMLHDVICRHWENPNLPCGAYLAPVTHRTGSSIAALPRASRRS